MEAGMSHGRLKFCERRFNSFLRLWKSHFCRSLDVAKIIHCILPCGTLSKVNFTFSLRILVAYDQKNGHAATAPVDSCPGSNGDLHFSGVVWEHSQLYCKVCQLLVEGTCHVKTPWKWWCPEKRFKCLDVHPCTMYKRTVHVAIALRLK